MYLLARTVRVDLVAEFSTTPRITHGSSSRSDNLPEFPFRVSSHAENSPVCADAVHATQSDFASVHIDHTGIYGAAQDLRLIFDSTPSIPAEGARSYPVCGWPTLLNI